MLYRTETFCVCVYLFALHRGLDCQRVCVVIGRPFCMGWEFWKRCFCFGSTEYQFWLGWFFGEGRADIK